MYTGAHLRKVKHCHVVMRLCVGLICNYSAVDDALVPVMERSGLTLCRWCQGLQLRRVAADGTPVYQNGDRTSVRAEQSRCNCGFKHYWDGKLYDNKPEVYVCLFYVFGNCYCINRQFD